TDMLEIDGNAQDSNASVLPQDWNTVGLPAVQTSGIVRDAPLTSSESFDDEVFTGGGTKDEHDLSDWLHKTIDTGFIDKDNITDAYAALYVDSNAHAPNQDGDAILYFGLDRLDTSGDSQVGF